MKKSVVCFCVMAWLAIASLSDAQHRPSCCLCGQKVCVLEVSQEKEEVPCFEVETKEICIPGIRLPWDPCGTTRCGGVRTVCVLTEESRETTVCKYDWSIKSICTTCCQHHGLKHGHHRASLQRDEQIPFAYYAADRELPNAKETAATSAAESAPRADSQLAQFQLIAAPQPASGKASIEMATPIATEAPQPSETTQPSEATQTRAVTESDNATEPGRLSRTTSRLKHWLSRSPK